MSEKNRSAMEGVRLESAQVLVELLAESVAMEKELLERRYSERARGFHEALKFMKETQALTERGRAICGSGNLGDMQKALRAGERTFIEYITRLIITSPTRYGKEMRGVLKAFRLDEGIASSAAENLRGKHYAARNFLLEAGAIRLDHETGIYTITSWFQRDFVRAVYAHGTTPDRLEVILDEQAKIGLAAELQVVAHEREMAGHRDAGKVVHISRENTNAGFDIASTRREEETDRLRLRMIEVKAVSPTEWAFRLTRNEIRVATENTDSYFLYLVPVIEGTPEVTKMNVIQDPVKELLTEADWIVREGDWMVSRVATNG